MRWLTLFIALVAQALVLGSVVQARDVVPAEKRYHNFEAELALCHDPGVLEEISGRFAEKELRFWQSNLTIVQYDRIQPVAWRPWGLDTVPRRFCTATATTSDGLRRTVNYSVREDLGFAGITNNTEFCVVGLDRNLAYSPLCKLARP